MLSGDERTAFRMAMELFAATPQNPEVPAYLAVQAAALSRDPALIREAARVSDDVRGSGAWSTAQRLAARAMLAAVEGRTQEAITDLREARAILLRVGLDFDIAIYSILAATLLPDQPEVRTWAEEVRPLLEELRAAPWLKFLDQALGQATPASTSRSEVVTRAEP